MTAQLLDSDTSLRPGLHRRTILEWGAVGLGLSAGLTPSNAPASIDQARWTRILAQARGQTVYFNAWGGAANINAYIQWAAEQAAKQFGVRVVHVKVTDTANVVQRVRNEKAAAQSSGSVDLVWINGANFLAMKREGLLFGPFTQDLPAFACVDTNDKATALVDFAEPVDGMEAPWGMAQLTFMVDSKRIPQPPQSLSALLDFARKHPGRVSYPRPPDFHGLTFIKQVLIDSTPVTERAPLYQSVTQRAFSRLTTALWLTLDKLHPTLWRGGKQFPNNAAAQLQMMADGELMWALTFNPNEAASEIAARRLSPTTISYQFSSGTIGNTHFLAIPFNTTSSVAGQVFTNFLLGPEAQARKADVAVWGDPTVLAHERLSGVERSLFMRSTVPGQVHRTAPAISEPHGSWAAALEMEWTRRYGV